MSKTKVFVCIYLFVLVLVKGVSAQELISIPVNGMEMEVIRNAEEWELKWEVIQLNENVVQLDLDFTSIEPISPSQVLLKWKSNAHGIAGIWHPVLGTNKSIKPDWARDMIESRAAVNAPVFSYFSHDDSNLLTVASSEGVNTVSMHGSIREEDAMLHSRISLFTELMPAITSYKTSIRIDARKIPFDRSLQDVTIWWETFEELAPAPVPELARYPMYSTWYSYHQSVGREELILECKKSNDLGYRTIIVDDGWQTLDGNRGYAFTGDWKPDRIPDMADFVEEVHKTGMKFMLWYSVPFVGIKSEAYEKFRGKFLFERTGLDAFVLDPRYPEVRQYLIDIYKNALTEWDLDGFKLDFIDDFHAVKDTELTAEDGRDFASVNEAVDKMMTDIINELRTIDPDVLIEFRQRYIGPAMRKYGNMFRAADCPNDAVTNRVRITDLRLISGNTAVHSDMLMWDKEEPVETAALQLLNIMFSVPQLSVRLDEIPDDHLKMVRFYTDYWNRNRGVLLDGEFKAVQPLSSYPVISATNGDHQIIGLYGDNWINLNVSTRRIDVINGKTSRDVLLNTSIDERTYEFVAYSSTGEVVSSGDVIIKEGINAFSVPPSGLLTLSAK